MSAATLAEDAVSATLPLPPPPSAQPKLYVCKYSRDAPQDDDDDVNAWIEKQKKATVDKQSRDKETALRRCGAKAIAQTFQCFCWRPQRVGF